MIRIIASLIFILCGQLVLAQIELFELQVGIKSITTIQIRGNSEKLDSTFKKSMRYDEQGRLIEIAYQQSQFRYEYTNDTTVRATSTNSPKCVTLYTISRKDGKIVVRAEEAQASSTCSYMPSDPMPSGNLNADSLFQDVPRFYRRKGREYSVMLRQFGEEEGEYMDFEYSWNGSSRMDLKLIIENKKIAEDWFVRRTFFVLYKDRTILEQQGLFDQEGMAGSSLDIREIYTELDPEQKNSYEYERDAMNNWTSRKPKSLNPERIQYTIREIEYWD